VPELRRADATRLLEFVADAQEVDGPEPFTLDTLAHLAVLSESDSATYAEYEDTTRRAYRFHLTSGGPPVEPPLDYEWARSVVVSDFARAHDGDVVVWSDHIERPRRLRFETVPWAGFFGLVDQIHLRMWSGTSVLLLSSLDRDFTARDRQLAAAIRPHAASLVRHARGRRLLAALQAAVDAAEAADPRGFVIVGSGDVIEYASAPARRLLAAWFGNASGGRLPTGIAEWLASPSRDERLRVESNGTRLVVEAPTRGALLVSEERLRPPLTARELDVLRALATGKSTAEIARELYVTPATVSKHLEHVYRKLGVPSRTAALAAIGARVDALR
jgi:DNA-binding CsgD family transcriptional regulator